MKPARTKAEQKFAASDKAFKEVMRERQKEQIARAQHVEHLRALRLAKEAEDKKAEELAAASKPKTKRKKKPADSAADN